MQQFTLIWLITGGGPVDATPTLAPAIYMQAFRFYDFGYASAMAVVGLVFAAVATLAFVAIQRRMADAANDPRRPPRGLRAAPRSSSRPSWCSSRSTGCSSTPSSPAPTRSTWPPAAPPPRLRTRAASPASSAKSRSPSGSPPRPTSPRIIVIVTLVVVIPAAYAHVPPALARPRPPRPRPPLHPDHAGRDDRRPGAHPLPRLRLDRQPRRCSPSSTPPSSSRSAPGS